MKTMTLVKYGNSDQTFQMREAPDPTPAAGEVVVRTEASGINFADVEARLGIYREAPPLPCVLGYEAVGWVEKIGKGVTHVKEGQRVIAFTRFGGYASKVKTIGDGVMPIPDSFSPAVAAALGTQYCTAWFAAEEMVRLHKGDRVLVQAAAGGVGLALVQLAKRKGCEIFGTASSPEKLELLKKQGVHHPINYQTHDFATEVRRITGGKGIDVAFDSVGGASFRKAGSLLAPGGRLVSFGASQLGGATLNYFNIVKTLLGFGVIFPPAWMMTSRSFIGINMLKVSDEKPEVLRRCLENVVALAQSGELAPVSGGTYPVEKMLEAHHFVGHRKSVGKVVVTWH